MSNNAQYMADKINEHLKGWEIKGAAIDDSDPDDLFFGFTVTKGKLEKVIWVLRDAEGNGPGWLDII